MSRSERPRGLACMTLLLRRILLLLTSAIGLFVGAWAAFLPQEFYDSFPGLGLGPWVGVDGPFNEHLVRDVGALYLGLAAAGIVAAASTGVAASRAVAVAWIVFSVPHLAYHLQHGEGLDGGNMVAQAISLSSTIVLAVPLLLPDRARKGPRRDATGALP